MFNPIRCWGLNSGDLVSAGGAGGQKYPPSVKTPQHCTCPKNGSPNCFSLSFQISKCIGQNCKMYKINCVIKHVLLHKTPLKFEEEKKGSVQ